MTYQILVDGFEVLTFEAGRMSPIQEIIAANDYARSNNISPKGVEVRAA